MAIVFVFVPSFFLYYWKNKSLLNFNVNKEGIISPGYLAGTLFLCCKVVSMVLQINSHEAEIYMRGNYYN